MSVFVSFVVGLLFGLGLIVSGMSNPAKVLGFLDLAGPWDPSLLFVMGGAVAVGLAAFRIACGRTTTWLGAPLRLPERRDIDSHLVLGAMTFGAGWGIAGICPGPALTLVGYGNTSGIIFVTAMIAGMASFELFERLSRAR